MIIFLDPPLIEHTKKEKQKKTKIEMCNIQRPLAAVYFVSLVPVPVCCVQH